MLPHDLGLPASPPVRYILRWEERYAPFLVRFGTDNFFESLPSETLPGTISPALR
ncbi:MAG: hypothetical protein JWO56_3265 [Acidobacteria bacterium]|nr:hypothetical protein [Acidobacteriota bacterium]